MDVYQPAGTTEPKPEPPETSSDDTDLDQAPTAVEKQARTEYLKKLSNRPSPKSGKKRWLIVATIVVLLLIGGGIYYVASSRSAPKVVPKHAPSVIIEPSHQSNTVSTLNYVSKGSDLNLSFDYPSNWKTNPASGGNSNDQTITVTSPLTTITSASGQPVTGKVAVSLRPGSVGVNELSSGKSTIAQASVQFAYTKPTASQYQYPYLVFIHLAGGTNPTSEFEEVLVSGTTQFAKGQSITEASLSVDPIIAANFYECANTSCSSSSLKALGITGNTWQSETVFQQTLALIESLQMQ